MKGLYFYKLVSPYEEDVTKDCKLTVNEIDHNFITLKDADIKDAFYDSKCGKIILNRNNGDAVEVDLSTIADGMTMNLDVDYDSNAGIIEISYNDKKVIIDGIITQDNLSKKLLTEVVSDSTLSGRGTNGEPLRLSMVEATGVYKPAKRFINLNNGEFLPKPEDLKKGDRFVVYERINDYGMLYNYHAVKHINDDLSHGWRIPTKEDWDNMLNAIEPCDVFKNHDSSIANQVLGKFAGKFLKKTKRWFEADCDKGKCECDHNDHYHHLEHHHCNHECDDEIFDYDEENHKELNNTCDKHHEHPKQKPINPKGVDKFGMGIVPSGYGDGCKVMEYFGKRGEYWTYTITEAFDVYTKRFDCDKAGVVQKLESPASLYSIRLVRDYDGENFHEVESINGEDYPCVLLPSENSKYGFAIWTATNLAFDKKKYNAVLPNNGKGLEHGSKNCYFIYAWDGNDFVKKQMHDGESIVLKHGLEDEYNAEYRLMHGKLTSVNDIVYEDVLKIIGPRIESIEENVEEIGSKVEDIEKEIENIESGSTEVVEKLEQEILDRKEVDEALQEQIDSEIEKRTEEVARLDGRIDDEEAKRAEDDAKINERIDDEVSKRAEDDAKLNERVDAEEAKRAEEVDRLDERIDEIETKRDEEIARLDGRIDVEEAKRAEEVDRLDERIDEIETKRDEEIARLDGRIDAEETKRAEDDAKINERIDAEETKRAEDDAKINERVDTEEAKRAEEVDRLDERIDAEEAKRAEDDDIIKGKLVVGGEYDVINGILTLKAENEENDIIITLNSNYGTF